jgi:heme-degrading monooxygenase HmoA
VISRQWRGLAHASRASDYERHLREDTFPQLRRIPGFVDASILRRNLDPGVEFLVVTRWASMAAIREFAGNNAAGAVVPPEVRAMMIEYDKAVRHYEIVD